jgi:hypothetical protein
MSFFPENVALGPIADSWISSQTIAELWFGREGEGDMTLFSVSGVVAAIISDL